MPSIEVEGKDVVRFAPVAFGLDSISKASVGIKTGVAPTVGSGYGSDF